MDAARRTLADAAADVRARSVEQAARDAREWTGPTNVIEVERAFVVLGDDECRTSAELVARFGRKVGYSLVLHGSGSQMWTLAEFGGSVPIREMALSAPHVTYVERPSWGQER
jgi:hypothetical protein